MPQAASPTTDHLNRYARRGLIASLLLILLLGTCAALTNLAPASALAQRASQLLILLPVVLVFVIVWIRVAMPRGQRRITRAQIQSIAQDELRQNSMSKAWRASLIGVLLCQPVLAVALTALPTPGAPVLMAAATVLVGASFFLGTLLFCDRP